MRDGPVVVTGAASGIGAAVAQQLSAHGYSVVLLDSAESVVKIADDLRRQGRAAFATPVDVSNEKRLEDALDLAQRELGPPWGLVAAAGIMERHDFLALEVADWERTLAVNLTGTWLSIQRVARRMVAAGVEGSMVGLASISGRGPRANAADYAASKAGVISVCRSAAVALASRNIRVNAVCPGIIDTPMTHAIHEKNARELGIAAEVSLGELLALIPLGRIGQPNDVVDVIEFLLSDASRYVVGQAINVCGGLEFA